tara:strand:+ start:1548 stop:1937 length:390 start_codon:yes stop_codon:yes gene_type:complete
MAITKASEIIREATREDPKARAARIRKEQLEASRPTRMATGALKRGAQGAATGGYFGPIGAIVGGGVGVLTGLLEEGLDASDDVSTAIDTGVGITQLAQGAADKTTALKEAADKAKALKKAAMMAQAGK